MNDNELITALREQRGKVSMTTPAEQIISRGRAVRARRRVPAVAGALVAAAAAAVAVTTVLPASSTGHPGATDAQLTSWSVARQDNGRIRVTIRDLRDPAGLQHRIRAEGVPASVTFSGRHNPACLLYAGGGSRSQRHHLLSSVYTVEPAQHRQYVVNIHPAGLPPGAGVQIQALFPTHPGQHGNFGFTLSLVQASPQCTGG
jgi:hypothetical protein